MNHLLDINLKLNAAGISTIPVDHRSKLPFVSLLPVETDEAGQAKHTWAPFQKRLPTHDELRDWFSRANVKAYAIVCGQVSGGLHVLDGDDLNLSTLWRENTSELRAGVMWVRTGSGKDHYYWRTSEPGRNEKYAWVKDESEEDGRRIGLESRAEGGYVLGPGSLHPSGGTYEILDGDIFNLVAIAPARHRALTAEATALDEAPKGRRQLEREAKQAERQIERTTTPRVQASSQGSVIDAFNARYTVEEILERNGYQQRGSRYARPGGSKPTVAIKDGKSKHYASNDPLHDEHWHDAFSVYSFWEHDSDITESVREAARELGLPPLERDEPTPERGPTPLEERFKATAGPLPDASTVITDEGGDCWRLELEAKVARLEAENQRLTGENKRLREENLRLRNTHVDEAKLNGVTRALKCNALEASERVIAAHYVLNAKPTEDGGYALEYASNPQLARRLNMSESTVQRVNKRYKDAGRIRTKEEMSYKDAEGNPRPTPITDKVTVYFDSVEDLLPPAKLTTLRDEKNRQLSRNMAQMARELRDMECPVCHKKECLHILCATTQQVITADGEVKPLTEVITEAPVNLTPPSEEPSEDTPPCQIDTTYNYMACHFDTPPAASDHLPPKEGGIRYGAHLAMNAPLLPPPPPPPDYPPPAWAAAD